MLNRVRFTKEEKEEDIQSVLQGLKEGQSYSKMANDLGRSVQYIANIKKVLIERGLITQEDINYISMSNSTVVSLKQTVLEKFKEGKNMQEMATELSTSPSTVSLVRDLLIAEGLITMDEINKANKKNSDRETLKFKILERFKLGMLSSQISSELKVPPTTISRIKRELISEGLISEQEISALQNKSLNEKSITNSSKPPHRDSNSPQKNTFTENIDFSQLSEQENQIINFLLSGYPIHYISKTLNIDGFSLTNIINTLKSKQYITPSQINKSRSNFKQNEEKLILSFLHRGYTQADILQELPHLTRPTLSRRVSALISSGKITKEQIEQYQYEAVQGEKEIMQFVLQKLKLGFTVKEIIKADENSFLTESRVINATKKLISQGFITSQEVERAKAQRTAKKKTSDYNTCDKKILTMLKHGLSPQEIADSINMGRDFVYIRIKNLKLSGKISDEHIQKAKGIKKQLDQEQKQLLQKQEEKRLQNLIKQHQSAKSALKQHGFTDFTCNKFLASCDQMFKMNILPFEDVSQLRKVVEYNDLTAGTINFMSRVYIHFKQYDEAIRFLNGCIGYLDENSALLQLSRKAKSAIVHFQKQQRAIDMLRNGMSIEFVFKSTGLSESEVILLSRKFAHSDKVPLLRFDTLELEIV